MNDELGISYDRFIRTTDSDHYAAAQAIWKRMEANGDIYLDKYAGWYSVRDEAFHAEDDTEVREDGVRYSKETDTEVTWTEEESYFFRLSAYQDKLLALYKSSPTSARPTPASMKSSASSSAVWKTCRFRARPSTGVSRFRATRTTSCTCGSTR